MNLKLSIGQRLGLGFGVVITLTIIFGAFAFISISNITLENKKQQIIYNASREFSKMESASKDFIRTGDEKNRVIVDNLYKKGIKNIENMKSYITHENEGLIAFISEKYEEFISTFKEVEVGMERKKIALSTLDQMSDKALSTAKEVMGGEVNAGVQQFMGIRLLEKEFIMHGNEDVYNNWLSSIDDNIALANKLNIIVIRDALTQYKKGLIDYVKTNEEHHSLEQKQFEIALATNNVFEKGITLSTQLMNGVVSNTLITFIIILIVIVLFGVVVAYTITNIITTGMNHVVIMASEIAAGNLNQVVDAKFHSRTDEVGDLVRSMHAMSEKIIEIVGNIQQQADTIVAASMQMSTTSQQISQGATEQASSSEEITSSIEEMASSIQQNTDNSMEAEKIAVKGAGGIENGSNATNTAVTSMGQIVDKISFVNEIARQTNILALNAAVEAARAGEYGRGFAVVADEVRKLAERSRIAAQEIDQISKNGMKVAENAGNILTELVPEIRRTAQLVQEISAGSNEQNSGANQINNAIQQLNTVTQQNAAASEELATASEELSAQALQLKEMIGFFKLSDKKSFGRTKQQEPHNIYANQTVSSKPHELKRSTTFGLNKKASKPQFSNSVNDTIDSGFEIQM
ncbi:MAG: methyl-accepting chemotaxis protein [Salinivirgaceae bacterium]|nr:methyl-accepting chemotaxis protein [Salinivirgaceae bacterium]MDD4746778.1 methyl-accepting chemotaxis protein [Salinivirgaceae bacterium]